MAVLLLNEYNFINHGECCHLFKEDCIKRYFDVFDPRKYLIQRISICNEYLRLKIEEEETINIKNNRSKFKWDIYEKVVCDIVRQYCYSENNFYSAENYNINPSIWFQMVYRPKIDSSISLFDAIEAIYTNSINTKIEVYDYDILNNCHYLIKDYISTLLFYIERVAHYLLNYKKYSYQKDHINKILRILKKYDNCLEHVLDYITELIILFFELQTNLKLKNGTSKQQITTSFCI